MDSLNNKTKSEIEEGPRALKESQGPMPPHQGAGSGADLAREGKSDEYLTILDSIEDGYWEVDLRGILTYCSAPFARLLGYRQEELPGTNYSKFMDEKTAREVLLHFNTVYRSGIPSKTGAFEISRRNGERIVVDISVSLIHSPSGERTGFRGILRDITEKEHAKELRENVAMMRKTLGQTINALSVAFELRDPYTAGHHRRVSDLSRSIGAELGLPVDVLDGIRIAGSVHDIGKISIPSEILNKPGRLTEHENSLVKTHCEMGYNILKNVDFPWPVAKAVYQHHEMIDGSGYPLGLLGSDMIIEAKIIAVANRIDAMDSHRPYRRAIGIPNSLQEIKTNRGILYDPDVVDACLVLFNKKGYLLKK